MTKPRGRHPYNRLTAIRVRTLKPAGRYADGNGLYLFIEPSGARRWILRTVIAGKRRDLGLGSAQLVPLARARVEAVRLRGMARAGDDPLAERRRERRPVLSFREAAKQVHRARCDIPERQTQSTMARVLEKDVFPVFGDRRWM